VICGSHGYTSGLAQIANEAGSDGTVRPAAANLNVQGLTIDFSSGTDTPDVRPWVRRQGAETIAFAVLPDRSHSSILAPAANAGLAAGPQLGDLVKRALESTADQYQTVCAEWDAVTAQTASLTTAGLIARAFTSDPPHPEDLTPHFQLVTRVVDDQDQPVEDYFLEFFSPQEPGEQDSVDFQRCVLKDSHPNSKDPSRRCLFLDRTALFEQFYNATRTELALSLSAAKIGPHVRYFDATHEGAKGQVVVHDSSEAAREKLGDEGRRLYRNRTHLIEIRIPRQPVEDVFTLTLDAAN
jgi:hypothetical protein